MIDLEAIRKRNDVRREKLEPHNRTGMYVSFEQYWNGAVTDVDALLGEVERLQARAVPAEQWLSDEEGGFDRDGVIVHRRYRAFVRVEKDGDGDERSARVAIRIDAALLRDEEEQRKLAEAIGKQAVGALLHLFWPERYP